VRPKDGRWIGANGKEKLGTVLRETFRKKGRHRDVRIIETRCMGICPKKAVTAMNASRPDRILTIPRRTAADEAIAQLMPEANNRPVSSLFPPMTNAPAP
jgi:hypothetical protein